MDKQSARAEIRSRALLTSGQIEAYGRAIRSKLLARAEIANARCVLVYLSADAEPPTDGIIEELLNLGKRVLVPVMRGGTMYTAEYTSDTRLVTGDYGIREPYGTPIVSDTPEVSVTPMYGFDLSKTRLGHGKGCYDRYFAKNKGIFKIGLCFERGKCYHIDKDAYDVDMDVIITEERVIE